MAKSKSNIFNLLNFILFALALVTIALGIYMTPDNGYFGEFLIVLGGTIFGTAFSNIISHYKDKDFFDSVLNILNQNQSVKIRSNENLISEFKKNWHVYYLTINNSGGKFWNYYNMDFSSSLAPGILRTEIEILDNDGKIHHYVMQGLKHDDDSPLVIFTKGKKSKEREAIMVLPNVGKKYKKYIFGFDFIETWNGQSVISPTIISQKCLHDFNSKVVHVEVSKELEKLWSEYSSKDLHFITKK